MVAVRSAFVESVALIAVGGRIEGDLLMVCTSQHVCTLDAGRRRHYGAEQADVRQAKISEVGHQ